MGTDIRAKLEDLLNGLTTGRLLEAFDRHYHDEVVMSENGEPDPSRVGKVACRAYEEYFVNHSQWFGAKVGAITVDEANQTSAYEMWMDFAFSGHRMQRSQVAVQQWKDGRIIRETFYYKG